MKTSTYALTDAHLRAIEAGLLLRSNQALNVGIDPGAQFLHHNETIIAAVRAAPASSRSEAVAALRTLFPDKYAPAPRKAEVGDAVTLRDGGDNRAIVLGFGTGHYSNRVSLRYSDGSLYTADANRLVVAS